MADLEHPSLKRNDAEELYVRDLGGVVYPSAKRRRELGVHLTSVDIFKKFILPEIKDVLHQFVWVDLFAGEGNLILPILEEVPKEQRIDFFKEHIFLFDIQEEMVEKCISNAGKYGIPPEIARENIQVRDTLKDYPHFIKEKKFPPFHITNPPYLYLGYIVKSSERNLQYFKGENEGYQDLYQIALMNDLRAGLEKLIYIIPTNFLFGFSVSNKIRSDFLPFYTIRKAIIFERKIFEFTGTNVCICFFERKKPGKEEVVFKAIKINSGAREKIYRLRPDNFYRAGGEFNDFLEDFRSSNPLKVEFYLTLEEVVSHKGNKKVKLLDANSFANGFYKVREFAVDEELYRKLKENPLFVRTLDTGGWEGRAGIYNVQEIFGLDGIVVTKDKYRTHPIQIFLTPSLEARDIDLLKDYFNLILEYFRDITDSEFMTTFKYSNSDYVRKYLGLSQTKKLIETFPILLLSPEQKELLRILVAQKNVEGIKDLLRSLRKPPVGQLRFRDLSDE